MVDLLNSQGPSGGGGGGGGGGRGLEGVWVPTMLNQWRGCPVGEHERTKYYKYKFEENGKCRGWNIHESNLKFHLDSLNFCVKFQVNGEFGNLS